MFSRNQENEIEIWNSVFIVLKPGRTHLFVLNWSFELVDPKLTGRWWNHDFKQRCVRMLRESKTLTTFESVWPFSSEWVDQQFGPLWGTYPFLGSNQNCSHKTVLRFPPRHVPNPKTLNPKTLNPKILNPIITHLLQSRQNPVYDLTGWSSCF